MYRSRNLHVPGNPARYVCAVFRKAFAIALLLPLAACVKDRAFPPRPSGPGGPVIAPGVLLLNEFVATGSQNMNEFGSAEDWIEIYNPDHAEVHFAPGRWYVSDGGPSNPAKYALPELTIPAHGHLVIWCDNRNVVETQVHANFALSSAGEHLVIYYDDGTDAFVVDDYQFGPQNVPGASEGRSPDGSDHWVQFTTPTPGQPNP